MNTAANEENEMATDFTCAATFTLQKRFFIRRFFIRQFD